MLKSASNTTRKIARLAIPLAGIALLVAPLAVRQSSAHSQRLGAASAFADESRISASLPGRPSQPAPAENASITIDYPQDGSIFPPDIIPPTFIWRDADASAKSWRIGINFRGRLDANPRHLSRRADPDRQNRSALRFRKQQASLADSGTSRCAYLDSRCRHVVHHQATFRRASRYHRNYRRNRQRTGQPRFRRSRHANHVERSRGRADFLSRRAVDAFRRRQKFHSASRAFVIIPHQLASPLY